MSVPLQFTRGKRIVAETAVDVARLFAAVESKARGDGISLRQAAGQIGVSPSLLSRLRGGQRPDLDAYASIVRWLERSADDFLASTSSATAAPTQRPLSAEIGALLRARDDLAEDDKAYLAEIFGASVRLVEGRRQQGNA